MTVFVTDQVSANIIGELIEKLKSEGISFEGKEETVKSLIAGGCAPHA